MSDEQLWRPKRHDDDDESTPELFDTRKWRLDKHDATAEQLRNGQYPLFIPNDWHCSYECRGIEFPNGKQTHSWNCPYWWNEGKDDTPFD